MYLTDIPTSFPSYQLCYVPIVESIYLLGIPSSAGVEFGDNCFCLTQRNLELNCISRFIQPKMNFCTAVVRDEIYILGGLLEVDDMKHCEVYQTQSDSWEEISPLNYSRFHSSACVLRSRYIYIFAGRSDYGTLLNSIEVYDTCHAENGWINLGMTLVRNIYSMESHLLNQNQILILGGKVNIAGTANRKVYSLIIHDSDEHLGDAVEDPINF